MCPDLFSEEAPCGSILFLYAKRPLSLRILGGHFGDGDVWLYSPFQLN